MIHRSTASQNGKPPVSWFLADLLNEKGSVILANGKVAAFDLLSELINLCLVVIPFETAFSSTFIWFLVVKSVVVGSVNSTEAIGCDSSIIDSTTSIGVNVVFSAKAISLVLTDVPRWILP